MCTEKNQKALLAEKMNELSSLVQELQDTNWMFEKKDEGSNRPNSFNKGIDERW